MSSRALALARRRRRGRRTVGSDQVQAHDQVGTAVDHRRGEIDGHRGTERSVERVLVDVVNRIDFARGLGGELDLAGMKKVAPLDHGAVRKVHVGVGTEVRRRATRRHRRIRTVQTIHEADEVNGGIDAQLVGDYGPLNAATTPPAMHQTAAPRTPARRMEPPPFAYAFPFFEPRRASAARREDM